jgi:transcriptional regulator with XRE-family HTH domain
MTYSTEQIVRTLREAREAKGLSQRALAKRVGLPQSHISKIENGTVDLRLSSLIEIARALGLEMTPVPRTALPAVQSIVRSTAPTKRTDALTDIAKEYQQLVESLNTALRIDPMAQEIAQMQRQVRDLQRLQVVPPDTNFLREIDKAVRDFNNHIKGLDELKSYLADIQKLRNSVVHSVPRIEQVKPAYSLEDESLG